MHFFLFAFIVSIFTTQNSHADLKDYWYQHRPEKMIEELLEEHLSLFSIADTTPSKFQSSRTVTGTYEQRLNPKDPGDLRTFKQRYFINSDFAERAPGKTDRSPVLYVICGEAACDGGGFHGAVLSHAEKFKAHLVALEHRFYGLSQPFPELTAENLAYLSTDFALEDLKRFQDHVIAKNLWSGPWVTIGGSYAGSLSAYYRLIYPNRVSGALASSAPVEPKVSFHEYDEDVTEAAGPECSQTIRSVVAEVEKTLEDPIELAKMKRLFGAQDIRDNIDFLYTLADSASIAIQYGKKDEFCEALRDSDPIKGYARASKAMFNWFGITPLQDSFQGAESTRASDHSQGVGMRQWIWQTCTEYGYFQVASPNPKHSTRSSLINLEHHNKMCAKLFGTQNPVNPDHIKKNYFLPLLEPTVVDQVRASKIFFTNGSTDPWKYLSLTNERGNNTNPLFSYQTMKDAAHCTDLSYSDLPDVIQAQDTFQELLKLWL